MKKAVVILVMLVGMCLCITNNTPAQGKYSDVRLKENGWIRIVKSSLEETSPEKFYEGNKSKIDGRKKLVKDGLIKRENFRSLYVTIQFLKPCHATTRADTMDEVPLSKKEEEVATALIALSQNSGSQMYNDLLDKYHDSKNAFEIMDIADDFMIPRFRCDYRIKVFTTFFFSKAKEIETEGIVPKSEWIKGEFTKYQEKRKTEMVPGETTSVIFSIPDAAESWQAWVPK